jgi:hypothetical protein
MQTIIFAATYPFGRRDHWRRTSTGTPIILPAKCSLSRANTQLHVGGSPDDLSRWTQNATAVL